MSWWGSVGILLHKPSWRLQGFGFTVKVCVFTSFSEECFLIKIFFVQQISLQLHWLLLNTFFPLTLATLTTSYFQLCMRQA